MILKWIVTFIRVLNSKQKTAEVAGGIAWGLLLALLPAGNLLWVALLLISYFLKVNFAAELLFLAIFRLIVPLVDPGLDRLGLFLLSQAPWQSFYGWLYNLPLVPFTRFNNTLVLGGLVAGVVVWVPAYLLFKSLVTLYREQVRDRLANTKLFKWFKKLPLVVKAAGLLGKAGKIYGQG